MNNVFIRIFMKTTIISLLISPRDYFGEHPQALDSLKLPVLIVLAVAIVGAISGFEIGSLTGTLMSQIPGGLGTIIAPISGVGAFFVGIVMWVGAAAIFHLISMVFKGKGPFGKILAAVGLGMLPQLFGGIVTLVLTFVYIPMVQVPVLKSFQDPAAIQAGVQALMNDPAMRELTQLSSVVSIIFLLWSANIWIFGVKEARGLPIKEAALTVLIPVVVYIIYTIYAAFFTLPGTGVI